MQIIDSRYFPLLKRGHSNLNRCDVPGCKGRSYKNHAFASRYDAAEEWAEERGLKPGIDIKII